MADTFLWYRYCPVCDGDGVIIKTDVTPPYTPQEYPCPECLGPNTKYTKAGFICYGIIEKINDI